MAPPHEGGAGDGRRGGRGDRRVPGARCRGPPGPRRSELSPATRRPCSRSNARASTCSSSANSASSTAGDVEASSARSASSRARARADERQGRVLVDRQQEEADVLRRGLHEREPVVRVRARLAQGRDAVDRRPLEPVPYGARSPRRRTSTLVELRRPRAASVRRELADPVRDLLRVDHEPVLEDVVVRDARARRGRRSASPGRRGSRTPPRRRSPRPPPRSRRTCCPRRRRGTCRSCGPSRGASRGRAAGASAGRRPRR